MTPLDREREALEKLREEHERIWTRLSEADRAHALLVDDLATADVDFPDFRLLVARLAVEAARVQVLKPRERAARERWEDARKHFTRAEMLAAEPPPVPAKSYSTPEWEV